LGYFPGKTFRVLKEKEEKQFGEYRTNGLVLVAWDKLFEERTSGSPIKRHLSREKSIPTVRGVSSSPSVVRIRVGETNQ
jgi:hypothetical protein